MSKSETRLLCEDESVRVGVSHSTGSQYFKMEKEDSLKKIQKIKTFQKYRTYILGFQFAILLMMIMLYFNFNGLLPMLFSSLRPSDTNSTSEQNTDLQKMDLQKSPPSETYYTNANISNIITEIDSFDDASGYNTVIIRN